MTDYRLLVTGSRSLLTWRPVYQVLWGWHQYMFTINPGSKLVIVHGDSLQGVDAYCRQFVEYMQSRGNLDIDQEPHPADWDGPCAPWTDGMCQPGHRRPSRFGSSPDYCPTAGHRRNQIMVDTRIDSYVAITDRPLEKSRGTWDCVQRAEKAGVSGDHIECRVPKPGVVQIRFDQAGEYIR